MPSEIPDKQLYEERNTDDIFARNVAGGFLSILNNKLVYKQTWDGSTGDKENITVPFYFNLGIGTSEDFIQDNYIFFGNKCGFKKVNGNFDMIPRGMISLSSTTIQGDSVNNRWVLGEFQKADPSTGEVETYVSFLYSLPLMMTFHVEIHCSRYGEMLKIDQACREFFYKNKTFRIMYKGMVVPCRAGYPDTFGGDIQSEYKMGSDAQQDLKLEFDVQIETYQPVFDPTTEMKASNRISSFGFDINTLTDPSSNAQRKTDIYGYGFNTADGSTAEKRLYTIDTPSGKTFPSDSSLLLKWNQAFNKSDMMTVRIEYSINDPSNGGGGGDTSNGGDSSDGSCNSGCYAPCGCDDCSGGSGNDNGGQGSNSTPPDDFGFSKPKKHLIAIADNHQEYTWHIPVDFTDYRRADVLLSNNKDIFVYRDPNIRLLPEDDGTIKAEDVKIISDGYFMVVNSAKETRPSAGKFDSSVEGAFSWTDKSGNDAEQYFVIGIENHKIRYTESGVPAITFTDNEFNPLPKQQFKYTGAFSKKNINIYISNPNDPKTETVIENVTVI